MYELLDINQNIITEFYKTLASSQKKSNWESQIFFSVKQAMHTLHSELPTYVLEANLRKLLQPLYDRKKYSVFTRNFIDEAEQIEVYHNTYDNLIDELSNRKNFEDQHNLELIDYIFDLLPYDKVTTVDGEKYLYSSLTLSFWGKRHSEALQQLDELRKVRFTERNIDTATNSNKAPKDKVKFLNDKFDFQISNPHVDSREEELQKALCEHYGEESRIIARSIYACSKIPKDIPEHFETKAIGSLEPYINSDGEITKKDLYMSWYAYCAGIYKISSDHKVDTQKTLELARLSSYVLFPDLRDNDQPICSVDTAKKPIRERAFFKGLRLHEFTDNRLKIKRSKEEIQTYEVYLKEVTKQLKRLS